MELVDREPADIPLVEVDTSTAGKIYLVTKRLVKKGGEAPLISVIGKSPLVQNLVVHVQAQELRQEGSGPALASQGGVHMTAGKLG